MDKPVINILTRTSNRPKGFIKCHNSIINQTYDNINHIVCYDDDIDFNSYLNDVEDITTIKINRDVLITNDNSVNPHTGKSSPHNLYCNELLNTTTEGYIMFLDDDDMLLDSSVIETIVNNIVDEDTMLFWKMRYPGGHELPVIQTKFIVPTLGNIGSPCFLTHTKWGKEFTWDSWKCGDFRYIKKVFDATPNYKWINQAMIQLNNNGDLGRKNDIN